MPHKNHMGSESCLHSHYYNTKQIKTYLILVTLNSEFVWTVLNDPVFYTHIQYRSIQKSYGGSFQNFRKATLFFNCKAYNAMKGSIKAYVYTIWLQERYTTCRMTEFLNVIALKLIIVYLFVSRLYTAVCRVVPENACQIIWLC